MKAILITLLASMILAACSSDTGELSERRSNCFGKLDGTNLSTKLIEVPQS